MRSRIRKALENARNKSIKRISIDTCTSFESKPLDKEEIRKMIVSLEPVFKCMAEIRYPETTGLEKDRPTLEQLRKEFYAKREKQ